jgi:putative membrane protein
MSRRFTLRPAAASGETFAASASATAVAVSGLFVLLAYDLGPRATSMATHIAVMSMLAPVAAALSASRLPRWMSKSEVLWLSAAVQLLLLWAWHAPAIERMASARHSVHAGAHLSLLLSSLMFWGAVIRVAGSARWHTIAALLLTGKLTCLLGALLVFSPRALYGSESHMVRNLDDQQLAGLLMLAACPLSYLVAAVVIVARLLGGPAHLAHPGRSGAG